MHSYRYTDTCLTIYSFDRAPIIMMGIRNVNQQAISAFASSSSSSSMASNRQSLTSSVLLTGQSRNDPLTASQVAVFYNGRVCICDFTELQARAIIWDARREMEEKMKKKKDSAVGGGGGGSGGKIRVAPPPIPAPSPGVSMKRSLQRFLQRRRDRIQAVASPYN